MGTYGFDDFKKYLKIRCGQRTDLEAVAGENIYGLLVNESYLHITTRKTLFEVKLDFRFPELETVDSTTGIDTTAGTAYVAIPTGAVNIIDVYDYDNEKHLDYITPREYFKNTDRYDADKRSTPTEWTRFTSYIYLHPTPDAAYTLIRAYRKIPTLLTGTTGTVIGAEWDPVILEFAVYKAMSWLQEFEKAKFIKEEVKDMLVGLAGIYEPEELQRDVMMRPSILLRTPGRK
jgi:hypothetical protein